jgi:formylglycine-generating enzyme required for sulfatase activity
VRVEIAFGSGLSLAFVRLPGGRFTMGSPEGVGYEQEHPAHEVEVAPFCLAVTEVTLDQWMADSSHRFQEPPPGSESAQVAARPIDDVTFCQAVGFANVLSARLPGAAPVYSVGGCEQGEPVGWDRAKQGVRLPTEAEWEYAARAGTATLWWTGDNPAALTEAAWFAERGSAGIHGVAQKRPNPWGLYDMNGNVWEWVFDLWAPYGAEPAAGETRHVMRGGGAWHVADLARSAFRYPRDQRELAPGQGLRLALDASLCAAAKP